MSAPSGAPPSGAPPSSGGPPPGMFLPGSPSDDLGPSVRAGIWILFALASVFLGLRVYCKLLKHSRLHVDDMVLIAAWVALLADCITATVSIGLGFGHHYYMIAPQNVNPIALAGNIAITIAIVGQCWSKVSFALTLMRISGKWTRRFLWFAIIAMNVLFGIGALTFWINCAPLDKAWKPLKEGKCWSPWVQVDFGIFVSAFSGIMDLCFAILPWRVVMGLQMKKREKLGVAIAMSMGVFAAVAAFIKCSQLPSLASGDLTYDGASLVIWGAAETAVCIMAASIPILRVLVKDVVSHAGQYYISNGKVHSRRPDAKGSPQGSGSGGSNVIRSFGESYKLQSQSTVQSVPPRDKFSQYTTRGDDDSDESPVASPVSPAPAPASMPPPKNGIQKTSEFAVRYTPKN